MAPRKIVARRTAPPKQRAAVRTTDRKQWNPPGSGDLAGSLSDSRGQSSQQMNTALPLMLTLCSQRETANTGLRDLVILTIQNSAWFHELVVSWFWNKIFRCGICHFSPPLFRDALRLWGHMTSDTGEKLWLYAALQLPSSSQSAEVQKLLLLSVAVVFATAPFSRETLCFPGASGTHTFLAADLRLDCLFTTSHNICVGEESDPQTSLGRWEIDLGDYSRIKRRRRNRKKTTACETASTFLFRFGKSLHLASLARIFSGKHTQLTAKRGLYSFAFFFLLRN